MPPQLHAVLGASSAHRWLACPPSARLNERLEARFGKKESEYAREGTRAHALGELKIRNAVYHTDGMTAARLSRLPADERALYPGVNDYRYRALRKELGDIPKDMEQATDSYRDVVLHRLETARVADPGARIMLEQRLDFSRWVPSGFGTGDCVIVSDRLLEIMDYKHGKGISVDAAGNPQIRLYALGAMAAYGPLYDFHTVRCTIIQPRLDKVTEETLTTDDLLRWAVEEVEPKARLAWAGDGEFSPGEHCRFCAAKAVCSARVAEALKLFQYGLEAPGLIGDEQLPGILETLDTAEAWIADIRAYAENQAVHGQRIPGWKLVRGKQPNRRWADPEEAKAQLLRAGYAAETFEETVMRSPGEVEKTLGKTAFQAILGGVVSQGEGRLVLVPESDKRLEYSSADAAFADLTEPSETDEKEI